MLHFTILYFSTVYRIIVLAAAYYTFGALAWFGCFSSLPKALRKRVLNHQTVLETHFVSCLINLDIVNFCGTLVFCIPYRRFQWHWDRTRDSIIPIESQTAINLTKVWIFLRAIQNQQQKSSGRCWAYYQTIQFPFKIKQEKKNVISANYTLIKPTQM